MASLLRRRHHHKPEGESIPLQPVGTSSRASATQDDGEEWTFDTLPVPQLLRAAWAGAVGGRSVYSAPADPGPDAPIDQAARDIRREQRLHGGRRHRLRRKWENFDVSQYADPSKALWIVLLVGALFWVFPNTTFAALGWAWRHTLGLPFQ